MKLFFNMALTAEVLFCVEYLCNVVYVLLIVKYKQNELWNNGYIQPLLPLKIF